MHFLCLTQRQFDPHLTVAKTSKTMRLPKAQRVKRFDEAPLTPFSEQDWGTQCFHEVELLAMQLPKQGKTNNILFREFVICDMIVTCYMTICSEDGFYHSVHREIFADSSTGSCSGDDICRKEL